jgi:hypothetical protein
MATENAINTGYPIESTHGGTGVGSPTAHTLPIAEGGSAFTFLGPLTDGELLIGSTGGDAVPATLTQGTNISITNASGSITIAATGGSGMSWAVITTSQTGAANHGYICNNAGTLVLTLPSTSAIGDMIAITGMNNATGWQVAQNAANTIYYGTAITTSGTGGSLTSSATRDAITLVCISANANWQVISSIGNITYA